MQVLIDADVLCYLSCPSRFKDDQDRTVIHAEKPTFTAAEDAKYLEICWKILKGKWKELSERFYTNNVLAAVKSPYNFREVIYPVVSITPPIGYKANRAGKSSSSLSNIVPKLRERLIEDEYAIEAYGMETDDMLRIWSIQATAAGEPYVVVTNDKDLAVIGGKIYNPKTLELSFVKPSEGLRFAYEQLLSGDRTDNIPGLPGIGPDKAKRALAACDSEDEFQIVVQTMYQDAFGDDWRNMLLSNGKMVHLLRHPTDYFSLKDWVLI